MNVLLLNPTDSALVTGLTTEENGTFRFDKLKAGRYVLKTSFVGFDDFTKTVDFDGKTPILKQLS